LSTTLVVLACVVPSLVVAAPISPLREVLAASGEPVYGGLGQAEHVYGYRFDLDAPGRVEALGGRFTGPHDVVLFGPDMRPLASATVPGSGGATWRYETLSEPVELVPGTSYTVATRADVIGSTTAAWSVSIPFSRGAVRVLGAVQGWSPSTDVALWSRTIQPLAGQFARGLVDVSFVATEDDTGGDTGGGDIGGDDTGGGDVAPPESDPGEDPHPATAGVIDSFGDAPPAGELGPGFTAVAAYYAAFPRRSGECDRATHDRYWTRGADGRSHPSWHPPTDPSGCAFAHEHGHDPRTSANYAFAGGVPFGVAHGDHAHGHRHEDHVGHKVVVRDGYELVAGNPQNGSAPDTEVIVRTGVRCDWLSKIHQGSWSRDALGNNAHEYFLNLRCTDGVRLRLKQLLTFGPPERVTDQCSTGSDERFDPGVGASGGVSVRDANDGKREFSCIDDALYRSPESALVELWKGDGIIRLPGNGEIRFSPYYAVLNPSRFMDHRWREQRGRTPADAYTPSLDLCFAGTPAWRGVAPPFCRTLPADFATLSSAKRQADPRSPMNGALRVVHPKELIVVADTEPGDGADLRFCTDRLGRDARALGAGGLCGVDEIEQLVSRVRRTRYDWKGSDANARIAADGTLRGAGFLAEWPLDFRHPTLRFPN